MSSRLLAGCKDQHGTHSAPQLASVHLFAGYRYAVFFRAGQSTSVRRRRSGTSSGASGGGGLGDGGIAGGRNGRTGERRDGGGGSGGGGSEEGAASASATVAVALTEEVAPEAVATASCARTLWSARKNTAYRYIPREQIN